MPHARVACARLVTASAWRCVARSSSSRASAASRRGAFSASQMGGVDDGDTPAIATVASTRVHNYALGSRVVDAATSPVVPQLILHADWVTCTQ